MGGDRDQALRRAAGPAAAIAIVVAAATGTFLWYASEPEEETLEVASREAPAQRVAPAQPPEMAQPVAATAATGPRPSSASREVIVVDLASVPDGAPVAFDLGVPAPPEDVPSLDVRLLSVDRRVFETAGAIGGDARDVARVEVEPGWLTPGRYLVEVKTKERTHFPLRRFVLEVR